MCGSCDVDSIIVNKHISMAGPSDPQLLNRCPMCSFEASTARLILCHLRVVHSNDPNFSALCGIEGCARSFRSFPAFYSHIYRSHRDCGIIFSKGRRSAAVVEPYSGATGPLELDVPEDDPSGTKILDC